MMRLSNLFDRFSVAGVRRVTLVVVLAFTVVSCAGVDHLFHLAATVDVYFSSGDFGWDDYYATASLIGSVLGSGSMG